MSSFWAPIFNPAACVDAPPGDNLCSANAAALLKKLEAALKHPVKHGLTGERKSLLRGHGLDFADLRQYFPGDDIRKIDWNVFARTMEPHIKEYHEEKQLNVWIAVDLTPSMFFGSPVSKAQKAVELAGLLGLLTQQGRHKLGFYLMTPDGHRIVRPGSGRLHLEHGMETLIRLVEDSASTVKAGEIKSKSARPDPFDTLCQDLARMLKSHVSVFLLSDFLTFGTQWLQELGHLSRQAQLNHVLIDDPAELALTPAAEGPGLIEVFDPESGRVLTLDTGDRRFAARYREAARAYRRTIVDGLSDTGTVSVAHTDEPPLASLLALLGEMRR